MPEMTIQLTWIGSLPPSGGCLMACPAPNPHLDILQRALSTPQSQSRVSLSLREQCFLKEQSMASPGGKGPEILGAQNAKRCILAGRDDADKTKQSPGDRGRMEHLAPHVLALLLLRATVRAQQPLLATTKRRSPSGP